MDEYTELSPFIVVIFGSGGSDWTPSKINGRFSNYFGRLRQAIYFLSDRTEGMSVGDAPLPVGLGNVTNNSYAQALKCPFYFPIWDEAGDQVGAIFCGGAKQ